MFNNIKGISPVIAVILLLSITVIVSMSMYNFLGSYVESSQSEISSGFIDTSRVLSSDPNRVIISSGSSSLNVSKVILDGTECLNSDEFYNTSFIEIDISSCSDDLSTSNPELRIITGSNELLTYTLRGFESTRLITNTLSQIITSYFNYTMDTDLGTVNASFLGESGSDYSGFSVSNAGDVNGDGFDDILVSAQGNDEGGSDSGQTYVIFGGSTE